MNHPKSRGLSVHSIVLSAAACGFAGQTIMDTASGKADLFPATACSWIDAQLSAGSRGRAALNQFLMRVYAEPLRAYVLGSSFRTLGEADDIINGFFASRLGRDDFVPAWRASGLRLRRWLMNAMCFYCRELAHQSGRRAAGGETTDRPDPIAPDAERDLERSFARSAVRAAMDMAQAELSARGLGQHFELFRRYALDGDSCQKLAESLSIDPARAWVMIRTAQRAFSRAVSEVVAQDGAAPADVPAEITRLMHSLGR